MASSFNTVNESAYTDDWFDGIRELTADSELIEDRTLPKLRQHSNNLIKNNFIASGAQLAYVNTILGGALSVSFDSKNKKLRKEAGEVFDSFKNNVDICREMNIDQLAEMIINSAFANGDVLINLPVDKRYTGKTKTYVELIEASRIKTPPKHRNNSLVKEGVHYYENGRLKGYWVITIKNETRAVSYYTAQDEDFQFFPVYKKSGSITRKVCHLFKAPLNLRPNQSRQIPVLTGIMGLLKYFNQYLEAVLIGSRVAACFSAFVKSANPAQSRKAIVEAGEKTTVGTKGKKLTKLRPGTISYIGLQEDITFASPNKPSDNFDAFVLRLVRFVSMELRIPYEQMFLDLSSASYSSWRGGSLETARNINKWRRDLTWVLKWIILTNLREAVVNGSITSSLKDLDIQIIFPKYKSLDEEKTARAQKTTLGSTITSKQQVIAENGDDYEKIQKDLDEEMETDVNREAKRLILQKELSEKHDIVFLDTVKKEETSEDPEDSEDLDEDDKKEKRKQDGNW